MRARLSAAVGILFVLASIAEAQAPSSSCDEQVTTLRIMAEQLAAGRQRAEIEAAQAIARLLGRVKALEAEVAALKKAAEKKETK